MSIPDSKQMLRNSIAIIEETHDLMDVAGVTAPGGLQERVKLLIQERAELVAALLPFAETYQDYTGWLASFQHQHSGRTIEAYLARGDVNNRRLNEADFKAAADAIKGKVE